MKFYLVVDDGLLRVWCVSSRKAADYLVLVWTLGFWEYNLGVQSGLGVIIVV